MASAAAKLAYEVNVRIDELALGTSLGAGILADDLVEFRSGIIGEAASQTVVERSADAGSTTVSAGIAGVSGTLAIIASCALLNTFVIFQEDVKSTYCFASCAFVRGVDTGFARRLTDQALQGSRIGKLAIRTGLDAGGGAELQEMVGSSFVAAGVAFVFTGSEAGEALYIAA